MEQTTKKHSSETYAEKGFTRQMIVCKPETHEKLKAVAKAHKVSQGDVIDILFADLDVEALAPKLIAHRETKVEARGRKPSEGSVIKKKLSDATPEQLAQIQAILAKVN
jgi:predicted nuclease of restriction endonuclease-like RecB superfamily